MFTKWQQVENWIRDNGLCSWRFCYDRTGTQQTDDGEKQTRSNRVAILSDAFPGDLEEKIVLTRRRLLDEANITLYGYGKRGKENTGLMYCEVRLVDELQQPSTQPVASVPVAPMINEEQIIERVRKEVRLEYENQRYQEERARFEQDKKEFERKKSSAIGLLVHHLSPVISALTQKRVAGLDVERPVHAAPVHAILADDNAGGQDVEQEVEEEVFTAEEADELFALMAEFKEVEPQYMQLIKRVVAMAKNGDSTYEMAKKFLLG